MSAQMIVGSSKLVMPSELRRLRSGSYESRIAEAEQRVRARMGETPFEVIATRESDVLVYAEGRFQLVPTVLDAPSTTKTVDVEVFDSSSLRAFVEREANTVADLFLRGSIKEAVARLENLVPIVPASQGFPREVLHVEALDRSPRAWRRIFDARRAYIEVFLGDEVQALADSRLRPCFARLYDGSIDENKLIDHADDVTEDLGAVLGRLNTIGIQTNEAHQRMTGLAPSSDEEGVLEVCRAFALDLVHDLSAMHAAGSKAQATVTDVRARGRLCDALIEALYDREVASRFVVVVANQIGEAS